MLRPVAVRQRREAVSSCQDFISHKVEPDQPGCFHGFIEVAIDGVFHHRPQLFECVALGVDAITQCGGRITTVHFVFAHLEDDLAHGSNLGGCLGRGKP
jgi:hypothetical protein